jgi:putative glycosyltransferase (TIGR04372 family)
VSTFNRLSVLNELKDIDALFSADFYILGLKYPWAIGHLAIEPTSFLYEVALGRRISRKIVILCDSKGFANYHFAVHYLGSYAMLAMTSMRLEDVYSYASKMGRLIDCSDYVSDDSSVATAFEIMSSSRSIDGLYSTTNDDRAALESLFLATGRDPDHFLLTLSVRQPTGRPQDSAHTWRDSELTPVLRSLEYAYNYFRGRINIVLTGDDIYNQTIPEYILNYPASGFKSEQIDIALLSMTNLHFGTHSGILLIPTIFRRSVSAHNMLPFGANLYGPRDFVIYKSIFDKTLNRFLHLEEYSASPFWSQSDILKRSRDQYAIIDNSDTEILDLMKTSLDSSFNNLPIDSARVATERFFNNPTRITYSRGSCALICPRWFSKRFSNLRSGALTIKNQNEYNYIESTALSKTLIQVSLKANIMQDYLGSTDSSIIINTSHPVAFESPDHIHPWGTARDNSRNISFNEKLFFWFPRDRLSVLDLGCSGGGFVKSLIESNVFAVGIEGSDYSKKNRRAEWATIPNHLFTADVTYPFELAMRENSSRTDRPLTFSVITSWEMIEHIAEEDLSSVFQNIDRHLQPSGVVIMSISPNDDFVDGVNLHQCVHDKPWWIDKLFSLGWKNHDHLVDFFGRDWVRSEPNAPGSFHVCLTRIGEEPFFSSRAHINSFIFAQHGKPTGVISKLLGHSFALSNDPFVVCDCGVRGGFEPIWKGYEQYLSFVGIDVDGRAVSSIDNEVSGAKEVALITQPIGAARFRALFRRTRNEVSSSFLPTNWEFVSRFPQSVVGEVLDEEVLDVVPLKSQLDELGISQIDYLKLDLEGYELDAIKGLRGLERSILCISAEIFFQPYRHGAPTYAAVEDFLRPLGFALFDLKLERWNRLGVSDPNDSRTWYGNSGQVIWGQAIFLRDPILNNQVMDNKALAKLAFIADILGFKDYALELVSKFNLLRFA